MCVVCVSIAVFCRAAAYLKRRLPGDSTLAVRDCDAALNLEPTSVKVRCFTFVPCVLCDFRMLMVCGV